MAIAKSQGSVLWWQIWGLAGMQGAIALMWVIYNLYLSDLLVQIGLPKSLAVTLLIIENLLAAFIEPLTGSLSDRTQRWIGSRLPFVIAGSIAASAIFIAIPASLIFGANLMQSLQVALPILLVAWAVAMATFRTPALSLLGRYAIGSQLPYAASILTLVGALAGAMAPIAGKFIVSLGAMTAFSLGSFVLLGAAAVLRSTHRWVRPVFPNDSGDSGQEVADTPPDTSFEQRIAPQLSWQRLGLIFVTGIGVAIGFRLMMQTFPSILQAQVPQANVGLTLGLIFLAVAVTAIPSGSLATKLGNRQAMILGSIIMAALLVLMPFVNGMTAAGILAIALGSSFSLISNGTIPFALSLVPPEKAGLGTGMFFSGGAIGISLFFSLFNQVTPTLGVVVGAGAYAIAGTCVALTAKR